MKNKYIMSKQEIIRDAIDEFSSSTLGDRFEEMFHTFTDDEEFFKKFKEDMLDNVTGETRERVKSIFKKLMK